MATRSVGLCIPGRPLVWTLSSILFAIFTTAEGSSCCCYGGCITEGNISNDGKKVNVAFNKAAIMSSYHKSSPACLAVNGNTSPINLYAEDSPTPNCVHSSANDRNAWWGVDLGQDYTLTSIVMYNRRGNTGRLGGAELLVNDVRCYHFTKGNSFPERIEATCARPLTGRLVRYRKTGGDYDSNQENQIINFCEMQIWVCKPGLYGQSCDKICSWGCLYNQTCDNYYGNCSNGCADGYYGEKCDARCGRCANNATCDKTSGHCPAGCATSPLRPTLCQQACDAGYYGDKCTQECGYCKSNQCDVKGECVKGCLAGYNPPRCVEACPDGLYGDHCTQECGSCENVCDKETGNCSCVIGKQPPLCNTDCLRKTYGQDCKKMCGKCKGGQACDAVTGNCSNGCQPGWTGDTCQAKCDRGYHGDECNQTCGYCLETVTCAPETGLCPDGCDGNFAEPYCVAMKDDEDSPKMGLMIGGIAIAVVVLIIIIIAVIWWLRKRAASNLEQRPSGNTASSVSHISLAMRSRGNSKEGEDNPYIYPTSNMYEHLGPASEENKYEDPHVHRE